MKKYTVTVRNEETKEEQQFQFEGYVLGGVIGRGEKRFQIGTTVQNVDAEEAAYIFNSLKDKEPAIRDAEQALMMEKILGRFGVTTNEADDDCDCDVCKSRREAEGADIQ